jgi:hypothetical protein
VTAEWGVVITAGLLLCSMALLAVRDSLALLALGMAIVCAMQSSTD